VADVNYATTCSGYGQPHVADQPAFDLQCHSTHSDGTLSPSAVVGRARAAGVQLLALTDHDTVAGVDEALDAAARFGIELVPAVELSCVEDGGDRHVCAYGVDHRSPVLLEALERWQADRRGRIVAMAALLAEHGLPVTLPDQPVLGRPHLARGLADHGLTMDEAFDRWLTPGRPAFVPRTTPSVAEAIDVVHQAGGLAVWAHPFWDVDDDAAVLAALDRYAAAGLDGVEVFYVTFDERQVRLLHAACRERGLLCTGSSDFHGPDHPHFNRFAAHRTYGLDADLASLARS
jgi:3',5'-nucleoside bisphosphate phosphatase